MIWAEASAGLYVPIPLTNEIPWNTVDLQDVYLLQTFPYAFKIQIISSYFSRPVNNNSKIAWYFHDHSCLWKLLRSYSSRSYQCCTMHGRSYTALHFMTHDCFTFFHPKMHINPVKYLFFICSCLYPFKQRMSTGAIVLKAHRSVTCCTTALMHSEL